MRIFITKTNALGDQVLTAGFVQALRRRWPTATLVWHVRPGMEAIGELIPEATVLRIDPEADPFAEAARLAAIPEGTLVLLPHALSPTTDWHASIGRLLDWWAKFLGANAWDFAICPTINRGWIGDFTVAATAAPHRYGFEPNAAFQPMIETARRRLPEGMPHYNHLAPSNLRDSEWVQFEHLLKLIAPDAELRAPVLTSTPASEAAATALLGEVPSKLILVAPGVGENEQRAWPVKRFAEVAEIYRLRGWTVRWIEGPADSRYFHHLPATELQHRLQFAASDFGPLCALLRRADLLLCNDTAYVHLAAAFNTPTVAIYGSGQRDRFVPRFGRVSVVQGDTACRGCQWQCIFEKQVCVKDVPAAAVLTAADALATRGEHKLHSVTIATPLMPASGDAAEEEARVLAAFQQEMFRLRWDSWTRLQIINEALQWLEQANENRTLMEKRIGELEATIAEHRAASAEKWSVIIPMGRPERADGTLRALEAQSYFPPRWELVLVGVNASSVRAKYPTLPINPVDLPHNLLPPRTRAEGVKRATGDWFLFVDDDIELAPDFFAQLDRILRRERTKTEGPTVGIFGVRLPGGRGTFFERLTDISNFWTQQSKVRALPAEVNWLYSAAIAVRAEAYLKIGGFNVNLPNGEDVDLSYRMIAGGYCLAYEPVLVAYHFHRRDTLPSMLRYFWRNGNTAQFLNQHHQAAGCFSAKTAIAIAWQDFRSNRRFNGGRDLRGYFWQQPWIFLNYLVYQLSVEWHYQGYLAKNDVYRVLHAPRRSDQVYVRAMNATRAGKRIRGLALHAWALLLDWGNARRR